MCIQIHKCMRNNPWRSILLNCKWVLHRLPILGKCVDQTLPVKSVSSLSHPVVIKIFYLFIGPPCFWLPLPCFPVCETHVVIVLLHLNVESLVTWPAYLFLSVLATPRLSWHLSWQRSCPVLFCPRIQYLGFFLTQSFVSSVAY